MSIQAAAKHNHLKWQAIAAKAQKKPETRFFIDGKFVDAKKGGRIESVNPANGRIIAEVSAGTAEDVDRAVAAALKAISVASLCALFVTVTFSAYVPAVMSSVSPGLAWSTPAWMLLQGFGASPHPPASLVASATSTRRVVPGVCPA
jgi:hypothetical protein